MVFNFFVSLINDIDARVLDQFNKHMINDQK